MPWKYILYPVMMFIVPRFARSIIKKMRLVVKLLCDRRVPLLNKLLFPSTFLYFLTPLPRIPYVGIVLYLIILWVAVQIFLAIAPRRIKSENNPDSRPDTTEDKNRTVDADYNIID